MTVHHLHPVQPEGSEDRDLTPTEQTLSRVRLAAFSALECGASKQDIDREIAEAYTIYLRMQRGGVPAPC